MSENQANTWLRSQEAGYLFAGITLLIWSAFPVISRMGGTGSLTVFDILALRVGVGALVLLPWWLPRLLQPAKRKLRWYQSLWLALLAGIGYPLIAFTALVYAPANHGAVFVVGFLPLFTCLLMYGLVREVPDRQRLFSLGFILAGASTLFISYVWRFGLDADVLKGDAILLLGSFAWAVFTVTLKRWGLNAFDTTLGIVSVSALLYLPVYALFLPKQVLSAPFADIALQGVFQGLMVTVLAMFTYARAIEALGAVRTVILVSATPLVGTLMSAALLNEALHIGSVLGSMIVFVGAAMGSLKSR